MPSPLLRARAVLAAATAAWTVAACSGRRAPGPGTAPPDAPPAARADDRPEPETPGRWYWAYVANRSSDVVTRIRFGPGGASYEKSVRVGVMPEATDGPVSVRVTPDGEHWYVATASGPRAGRLYKYETGTDRRVAALDLGASPLAVDLAPDGSGAWVAAAEESGGGGGGSITLVRTDSLREAARLEACPRASGGRTLRAAERLYVACAGADLLVEVDPGAGRVRRSLELGPAPGCRPAALAAAGDRLWVACAAGDEVVEVGAGDLGVRRRIPVGAAPAALDVSPDGELLVAANREDGSVSVMGLDGGRELARIATSRPRPRAVAVSGDGRYAFVSNGSGGTRRSTVDVLDLRALVRVAEVEVEHGAAGIAYWRSAPVRR